LQIRKYRKFKEQTFTQQITEQIVKRMHNYSTFKNILWNEYKLEYIKDMIKMILDDYISPKTIRVYVIRDNLINKMPECDNAIYLEQKISKFMIDKWKKPPSSKLLLPNLEVLLKQSVCNFFIILNVCIFYNLDI